MSVSTNVGRTESEQYQSVLDWVEHVDLKNLEDLRTTFAPMPSFQGSDERINVSPLLQNMIRNINELRPELRSDVMAKIAAKIQQVSELKLGEATPEVPRIGEKSLPEGVIHSSKRTHETSTDLGLEGVLEPPLKRPAREQAEASACALAEALISDSKTTTRLSQSDPVVSGVNLWPQLQGLFHYFGFFEYKKRPLPEGVKVTSIEDLAGLPLQRVVGLLDPKSLAKFAKVNRTCRDAVNLERMYNLDRFLKHKALQSLLPFYLQHLPSIEMERNSTNWSFFLSTGSELFEVVKTSSECILNSSILSEKEKAAFQEKSAQDIISDPSLLYSLLKTDYDRNLVKLSTSIYEGPRPDLSALSTLSGKAEVVVHHFKEHGQRVMEIYGFETSLTCIPQEICLLPQLKKLTIKNSLLRVLPACIGNLKELTILDLSGNELNSLPNSIDSLCALQCLDLASNELSSLPDTIGSLCALWWLFLDHNRLSSLPSTIGSLSSLRKLSLGGNQLTSLPASIGFLCALQKLALDRNQLQSLSPESLNRLQTIQEHLWIDGERCYNLREVLRRI